MQWAKNEIGLDSSQNRSNFSFLASKWHLIACKYLELAETWNWQFSAKPFFSKQSHAFYSTLSRYATEYFSPYCLQKFPKVIGQPCFLTKSVLFVAHYVRFPQKLNRFLIFFQAIFISFLHVKLCFDQGRNSSPVASC